MRWRIFIGLMLSLWIIGYAGTGPKYLWPTDASRYLTSAFCEFRPRHFHAAIDIKTWGRTGYRIFAISDGYVYRVRISDNGYGRAIYLKLRDGNIVIYAHLLRFMQPLESWCDSKRIHQKKNTLDAFFKPNQFPVKKGQFLGYTGESGIGVPHLHFEIRDPQNRPINPLQFYRDTVQDTRPPIPFALAVIPATPRSLVNLFPDTLLLPLPARQHIILSEPIFLAGKAYLAVKAYDIANGVANKFGLYGVQLEVNDKTIFTIHYDRFSYARTYLVELDKNYSLWRRGLGIFQNLVRHPMNSLETYQKIPPDAGLLDENILTEGENHFRIRLQDYFNNTSVIEGTIFYHNPKPVQVKLTGTTRQRLYLQLQSLVPLTSVQVQTIGKQLPAQDFFLDLNNPQKLADGYAYYFSLPIHSNPEIPELRFISYYAPNLPAQPSYLIPTADSTDSSQSDPFRIHIRLQKNWVGIRLPVVWRNEWPFRDSLSHYIVLETPETIYLALPVEKFFIWQNEWATVSPWLRSGLQNWKLVSPLSHSTIISPDSLLRLEFPPHATYDSLFCQIRRLNRIPTALQPDSAYPLLSPIYDCQPFDQPLQKGAWLSFTLPDSVKNRPGIAVYYWDMKKGWLFLPTKFNAKTAQHRARITSLEKFVLIQDTIPPVVEIRPPVNRHQRKSLTFYVEDEMSGIFNENQITVLVNGQWTPFEYDSEEHRVEIPARFLPKKLHQITFIVKDNVGNINRKTFRF